MSAGQTWDLYCREISATFEHLHQFGSWVIKQFKTTIPEYYQHYKTMYEQKYCSKLSQISKFLSDFSPAGEELFLYQGLLEAYSWITICLLINSIFFTIGRKILNLFISTYYASVFRFFALAMIIYAVFKNEFTEEKRRLCVLMWSVLEGLLFGCLSFEMYLNHLAPPVYTLSASVAFTSVLYNKNFAQSSRISFLAASLAPGILVTIFFAILCGQFEFGYLIWIILLVIVLSVDLQVKIGQLREGRTVSAFEQLISILSVMEFNYLCMYLFSVKYKDNN